MSIEIIKQNIKEIPDFPKKGILFRDINPLLNTHFQLTLDTMAALLSDEEWANVDSIAGIEARGFFLAAGLAAIKGKGVIPIRKKGKLPGEVKSVEYELEYGTDALEMAPGQGRILLVDDVLATGGTLNASIELANQTDHVIQDILVLINLTFLNDFSWNGKNVRTLIDYD
jgi:adenine phosphoribosyltransferase